MHPSNAQSKENMEGKEREPKGPYVFHAARVKQIPEHATKLDKPRGNGKRVKAIKVIASNRSGACT